MSSTPQTDAGNRRRQQRGLTALGRSQPQVRGRNFSSNQGGNSAAESRFSEDFQRRVGGKGPLGARLESGHGLFATVGLLLAALSLLFLGHGGWKIAKAHLAQLLLDRSWDQAVAAGGAEIRPWPWADTWPVARLQVPELGIDHIVLAGAAGNSLAFGPGHLTSSAAPGTAGNVVIAGHRDTHFRFLQGIKEGTEIVLVDGKGGRAAYRVESTEVVDHRDTRVLAATEEPVLTLITCYPFDAVAAGGPLRWVVRARPALAMKIKGETSGQKTTRTLSATIPSATARMAPVRHPHPERVGNLKRLSRRRHASTAHQ